MGILDDAKDSLRDDGGEADTPAIAPTNREASKGAVATMQRGASVTIDGESFELEDVDTVQTGEEGTWLTESGKHGRPRGRDAIELRQIVQTSAMQSIVNGIVDQLLGGDLVFESDDDEIPTAAESLRDLIQQVLTGPHLQGESLDDLVTAAVEDMVGIGNAYWQLIGADGIPVAALTSLDPLTIRRNMNRNGEFRDPPYWQTAGFSGGQMATLGGVKPTPLDHAQLFEFNYPKGYRSWSYYPKSAAWQVKEWLEILANSTTHHNRFYSDDEIPPGLIQIVNASGQTVEDVKEKIQESSGDPRSAPVIGGEGGAQWIEMGGTSINLAVVEEQRWFYFLCLGSLGLGKSEVGFVEDTNRANGEIEATRVFKRVTGPFRSQFEEAFLHVARQFDAFTRIKKPFTISLEFTDPREQRAKEERLRKSFQQGVITLRQYLRRTGNEDVAADDDRFVVTIDGKPINYADHPRWVVERMFSAAGATDPDEGGNGGAGEEQTVENFAPAGGGRQTNGGGD